MNEEKKDEQEYPEHEGCCKKFKNKADNSKQEDDN